MGEGIKMGSGATTKVLIDNIKYNVKAVQISNKFMSSSLTNANVGESVNSGIFMRMEEEKLVYTKDKIYEVRGTTFIKKYDMPQVYSGSYGPSLTVKDGIIYAFYLCESKCNYYKLENGLWTKLGIFTDGSYVYSNNSAFNLNNKIYIARRGNINETDIFFFDTVTNEFQKVASFQGRFQHVGTFANGLIQMYGKDGYGAEAHFQFDGNSIVKVDDADFTFGDIDSYKVKPFTILNCDLILCSNSNISHLMMLKDSLYTNLFSRSYYNIDPLVFDGFIALGFSSGKYVETLNTLTVENIR